MVRRSQIIAVLREHKAGVKVGDLARKHAASEARLYNWKAKYGGMDGEAGKQTWMGPMFARRTTPSA